MAIGPAPRMPRLLNDPPQTLYAGLPRRVADLLMARFCHRIVG